MKKILLLGGSYQQIIAITTAKKLGYYTILCDFLDDNPGQKYCDKFYLASTTDKDLILDIAKKEKIDGILAYASDPAAPTAAYVAEKMGLPGNPYKAVEILCNKDIFRKFLYENGFNTPKAKGYTSIESALDDLNNYYFKFPVLVKPVDSSGSKGISLIKNINDVDKKLENALKYSIKNRILIEEYVEQFGYQVAGDGLSIDGKLIFRLFGNDHFDPLSENPFVPISASFPYNMPESVHNSIHNEIQRLITLLGMKSSTYNFDIRIDKDYNVFLMEIAPRSGGNYIPDIIKYATGIDMVEYAVKMSMGEKVEFPNTITPSGYWSYYAIHSYKDGILERIDINESVLENNVIENHIVNKPGDYIHKYIGSNTTLGILLMKFNSMEEMLNMMDHSNEWINIKLKD